PAARVHDPRPRRSRARTRRRVRPRAARPVGQHLRCGGFFVANSTTVCHNCGMTAFVDRLVAEEHHLEEIAKDGYAPATLPIVLAGIVGALLVIVGLALGVTLAVYYLS